MSKNEFEEKVCQTIQDKLGIDYVVVLENIYKNSGIGLKELIIKAKNQSISPIIRLDFFYIAYVMGTLTFADITEHILEIYKKKSAETDVDFNFFKSFKNVKDRICYRLMNRERNSGILSEIPHKEYLDMILGLYYSYEGELGSGSILIFNSHMELWDTNEDELFQLAEENTMRLFPWKCRTVNEILEISEPVLGGNNFMRILSNTKRIHGAVCMLYPEVIRDLAQGDNLFIIPSSLHEVIILPAKFGGQDKLCKIIKDVNETQVSPLEVLSNSLYLYKADEDKIVICE